MAKVSNCLRDDGELSLSVRNLLKNALPESIVTEREKTLILQYRELANASHLAQIEEGKIISRQHQGRKRLFDSYKLYKIRKQINMYNEQLLDLERSKELDQVLEREETRVMKLRTARTQKWVQEEREREEKELRERYSAERAKAVRVFNLGQSVLHALELDDQHLTQVGSLSVSTVLSVLKEKDQNTQSFICRTSLACCDSVIFAAFLLRMLCLVDVSDQTIATEFTNEYIPLICVAAKKIFMPQYNSFDELFDNRIMFYEKILMSNKGSSDIMQALLEEFEIILKADVLYGKFVPFYPTSALPILGIDQDIWSMAILTLGS